MATQISWERFATAAKDAGCPRDQIENFIAGGYIPQPKQLEFHAMAREMDKDGTFDELGIGGSRGGSKSHAVYTQMVLDDAERLPGYKGLFLRNIGGSARESFEDLISKATPHLYQYYQPGNGRLLLPNGSRIVLGGFYTEKDIGKYLGLEYDSIAIEELTLLSKEMYDKLLGSLRSSKNNWRARLYMSTNPGGIGHAWVLKRFIQPAKQKERGKTAFIFAGYKDNKYLSPEYVRYLDGLTGWLGRAWREGDWNISAGQYFTEFDESIHVVEFVGSPYWEWWLAMDYGYQHYTVFHLFAKDGDGNVYIVDEHAERRWPVKAHADAVKEMVKRRASRVIKKAVAGSDVFAKKGDEATIAEQYKQCNIDLEAAQMDRINGWAEILKRLGSVEHGIKPTLFIHPRCARLIECLPTLQHDPHRPEDVLKVDCDDEGNGGDDAGDCARYGILEAVEKYGKPGVHKYV